MLNETKQVKQCLRPVMEYKRQRCRQSPPYWCLISVLLVLFWLFTLLWCAIASAEPIDMARIRFIESSNNPLAHNLADDSRGLYQITPICLKEYNNYHPKAPILPDELWDPAINTRVADWYLNKRIPQMLKYYGKPDTVRNRIIAFNAGISYIIKNKPLPRITKQYLIKYNREDGQK